MNETGAVDQRREDWAADPLAQSLRELFRVAVRRGRVERRAVEKKQAPRLAPHRLCALFRMLSNTGARSPGEELMTCSTSAVAVCCSSASCCSVKRRVFST